MWCQADEHNPSTIQLNNTNNNSKKKSAKVSNRRPPSTTTTRMRWFRSVNGDTSGAGPTDTATVSCDAPIHKLNYIFSCHLIAQLQIKM